VISRMTKVSSPVLLHRVVLTVILATAGLIVTTNLHAQSSGGLKLGQPAQPANMLDLGAAPAVDKTAPPTQPPTSKAKPSLQTGEPVTAASRTKYGAWEVACGPDGKNCAMAQIGNDAGGTPVLEMVVRKLEEPLEVGERTAIAVLDVITPLGVVLTEGLAVKIDGGKEESAPFQICTEQGCLVREPIDNELVTRLKRGNNAVVSVIAANQGEVSASLSLSGFTKAFGALK
jgi:invasion protein IalB